MPSGDHTIFLIADTGTAKEEFTAPDDSNTPWREKPLTYCKGLIKIQEYRLRI